MFFLTSILFLIGVWAASYSLGYLKAWIKCKKSLSLLPGPKPFLCFGNLRDLNCDDATIFRKIRKWSQEYYPVYNVSSVVWDTANISGPEDFKRIASSITKAPMYSFFSLWLGDGIFLSNGPKWHSRRKILTPVFHFSILKQLVPIFNNETNNLVEVLKKECHKPHINVIPHVAQFALYAINEAAMGTKLKLENKEDKSYISSIHQIGKTIANRMFRPWLYFNSIYYNFSFGGYKEKKLVKNLHHFTNTILKEKTKNFEKFIINDKGEFNYSKRKKLAMLDLMLNAKLTDGLIDDEGIQDELNVFMFGGYDTVSMALAFTLMLLACHKDVQELMLEEMNQILGDTESQPTYNDLQELNFMERCIKESLRLYPLAPYISRTLEEDVVTSNGYTLPKNTIVGIHIFDIHRDPKVWPDPEKFDPDRFLTKNCKDRHPFSYVPFSAGPRNCMGHRFAILEIKAVLCGILRNFILEPVDTPKSIVLIPNVVLMVQNNILRVKFIPRS